MTLLKFIKGEIMKILNYLSKKLFPKYHMKDSEVLRECYYQVLGGRRFICRIIGDVTKNKSQEKRLIKWIDSQLGLYITLEQWLSYNHPWVYEYFSEITPEENAENERIHIRNCRLSWLMNMISICEEEGN